MRQATVTVRGALGRLARDPRRALTRLTELRRTAGPTGIPARSAATARPQGVPADPSSAASSRRRSFGIRLPHLHLSDFAADRRGAPVLVLVLLLVASLLATMPDQSGVAIGATDGGGAPVNPRIAALTGGAAIADGPISAARLGSSEMDGPSFQTFDIGPAVEPIGAEALVGESELEVAGAADGAGASEGDVGTGGEIAAPGDEAALEAASALGEESVVAAPFGGQTDSASYTSDGTLLKPVVVDDDADGIQDQVKVYKVKSGDTLVGIAAKFDLDMYTLWWANRLKAKDDLHIGQKLYIPPTDGVLYTAQEGDTVETIAAKFRAPVEEVIAFNDLEGDTVVIGQQLMVPDGRGAAIPTPKPTPKPKPRVSTNRNGGGGGGGGGGGASCGSCHFGGSMRWPVPGGSINQRYHYGHYGLDIGADYGATVVAAAGGTVTFAGWRSNGGGYQVWISHGNGMYTTYNHMSSVSVSRGQSVGRGGRVGRIGQSGWATGPHLHFEVWIGPIWDGGHRVNPLNYL